MDADATLIVEDSVLSGVEIKVINYNTTKIVIRRSSVLAINALLLNGGTTLTLEDATWAADAGLQVGTSARLNMIGVSKLSSKDESALLLSGSLDVRGQAVIANEAGTGDTPADAMGIIHYGSITLQPDAQLRVMGGNVLATGRCYTDAMYVENATITLRERSVLELYAQDHIGGTGLYLNGINTLDLDETSKIFAYPFDDGAMLSQYNQITAEVRPADPPLGNGENENKAADKAVDDGTKKAPVSPQSAKPIDPAGPHIAYVYGLINWPNQPLRVGESRELRFMSGLPGSFPQIAVTFSKPDIIAYDPGSRTLTGIAEGTTMATIRDANGTYEFWITVGLRQRG